MMPRRATPWAILAGTLLLTLVATSFVRLTGRARDRGRFENAVQSAQYGIESRIDTYVALLRGTSGLIVAAGEPNPAEYGRYVASLEVRERYPGLQGIGFSRRVGAAELPALLRTMRAAGRPDFHVWPDSARAEYHAIVLLEPLDARNRAAIGYDMFTDSTRRQAMARARDSARVSASGRVTLVQEIDADRQAGFLIYLPLYRGGQAPATVTARRDSLLGFVYAPFRARDLFERVFAGEEVPRVSFQAFDGDTTDPARLLFDSRGRREARHTPVFRETRHLVVAGEPWTLVFASTPAFEGTLGRRLWVAVLVTGLLVSLALFALSLAQTRARGAAERSEAARTRFFAAMSHELRTPINAILGYNDLTLAGVYGPLTPELRAGIERSQTAARHLLELVNDVLDISKIEAGKLDIDAEPVNVRQLLDDLVVTVRPMASARGSEVRLECDGALPTIVSDPRRIRQIVLNLLSNAAKFGRGRPIRAHCAPTPDGGVLVEVADQGTGIAPEDRDRIFEEFVQLPNASGGTGLGLAISRRLAQLLGGRLELTSTVDVGSTFRLVLPARAPGLPQERRSWTPPQGAARSA